MNKITITHYEKKIIVNDSINFITFHEMHFSQKKQYIAFTKRVKDLQKANGIIKYEDLFSLARKFKGIGIGARYK